MQRTVLANELILATTSHSRGATKYKIWKSINYDVPNNKRIKGKKVNKNKREITREKPKYRG